MSKVEAYQKAVREVRFTRQRAEQMVQYVKAANEKLTDWRTCKLSNSHQDAVSVINQMSNVTLLLDGWPDAQALGNALAAWHHGVTRLWEAWRALTAEERDGFMTPEQIIGAP